MCTVESVYMSLLKQLVYEHRSGEEFLTSVLHFFAIRSEDESTQKALGRRTRENVIKGREGQLQSNCYTLANLPSVFIVNTQTQLSFIIFTFYIISTSWLSLEASYHSYLPHHQSHFSLSTFSPYSSFSQFPSLPLGDRFQA